MTIFYDVIAAINMGGNSITFPLDEAGEKELQKKEQGFLRISRGVLPGYQLAMANCSSVCQDSFLQRIKLHR